MSFNKTRFIEIVKNASSAEEVYRILEPYSLSSGQEVQIVNMYWNSKIATSKNSI